MPTRLLKLRCYHSDCANDPPLEISVEVPRWGRATPETKEITRQCERGHFNIISIPANWSRRSPVLGDEGIVGREDGVLVVQGRPK